MTTATTTIEAPATTMQTPSAGVQTSEVFGDSECSSNLNQLAGALAKAQGSITAAAKDSENPFFKSRYADLASCWDACRKPLSENGLAVIQTPEVGIEFVTVNTLLVHSSGQWIRSRLPMKPKDLSPQAIGAALTYARRYSLAAMVGIAQGDDDAESAQTHAPDEVDRAAAQSYAKRMQDALDISDRAVVDIHQEVIVNETFYRAMWGYIPSAARKQIKEVIERSKQS